MPEPKLPKGIKKEVLEAADPGEQAWPKKGDECTVHYVGRFEVDGDEFDGSRSRGSPLTFRVGVTQVIKAWDLAVATMRRGELSRFVCDPEYCYGEQGARPKIPPNATLVFEIELVDWRSDEDLFGDGSVIRTKLEEGSGFGEPGEGTEVLCSFRVTDPDGGVLDERPGLEYTVGSGAVGPLSRVIDRALEDMKKGARVSLRCSEDKRPDGSTHSHVTVELGLLELYAREDVSPDQDGSIEKKLLREGDDCRKPQDGGSARVAVEAAAAGAAPGSGVPGFRGRTELSFVVGNGEVCDAIEYAVPHMLKGERAVVACRSAAACADAGLGLEGLGDPGAAAGPASLTLELLDFDNGKPSWDMSDEEKYAYAAERKEVGGRLFKAQRYGLALQRYRRVTEFLRSYYRIPESGDELVTVCELNKAACMLKLGDHSGAKSACTAVLRADPRNVKALFRRASAYYALHEYSEAVADLKYLVEVDPENKEAQRLLPQAVRGARQEEKKASSMFTRMNKAFSGLADEEERTHRERKEAREAEIARKGAQAKAEAKKQREKPADECREDLMRAQQQMAEMQRKCMEMEMAKHGPRRDDD
mmetsp:Transcript_26680/g.75374  ORF Transcript_26680/g.75374 Transcript_26680/m.75374 type:complete len:590 (+) Transcript_26680:95-1864(+)